MFERETYVKRRNELKKKVKSGLIILVGNDNIAINYEANEYPFRQDSTFLYYVGIDKPSLIYLLDIDNDKEYLFGEEATLEDVIWMGVKPSLKHYALEVGISRVEPIRNTYKYVEKAVKSDRKIHFLKPYRSYGVILLSELTGKTHNEIIAGNSKELAEAIISMRLIKSPAELHHIKVSASMGHFMHSIAMDMCKPGEKEINIVGAIEAILITQHCRTSFPTILSTKGQILHNHDHGGKLSFGQLMLCDAGAETVSHYASDFTRTTPVGGLYTTKQEEIYNIVLKTINESISLARPDVTYKSIHRNAYRIIFEGLRDLGITKGDTEEALHEGAPALFMPHGLGHALGLDVHDMENLDETLVGYDETTTRDTQFGYKSLRFGRRLEPGHVLTVEPGIYFIPELIDKWYENKICRNFINFKKLEGYKKFGGIRLEDNIVITNEGCRHTHEDRLPITIQEVSELARKSE
ncbi:MAG: aminopeptidase P N-terminal domain-containing protein [Dysgonamonadaceae bacterium]|jgi:Xaa-Pro aminopeptidase|nr:aminopeptidase P N-terminal domain-containing protein [Dysgonamonadaceae bacterium]